MVTYLEDPIDDFSSSHSSSTRKAFLSTRRISLRLNSREGPPNIRMVRPRNRTFFARSNSSR